MSKDYLQENIKVKDILKDCPYEPALIENNEKQIEAICDFFQSNTKLLLVNGFQGTGKTSIVNFVLDNLNPQCFILKYKCFETTILDDMLLSFFTTFRKYTIAGKFTPPKMKAENFTQKINLYFNSVAAPMVLVIDSFDEILKDNKQDILNFINHLKNLPNIKIILISQALISEDFPNETYSETTILALSKSCFEKYLKKNGIKSMGLLTNELYKQSKGYFGNVMYALKIIDMRQYTINKLLDIYSKSYMSFSDFILREMTAIIDPTSTHLFRLLAVMRIPIHVNLLKTIHLYNEERIKYFIDNSLLAIMDQSVYLPAHIREVIEGQIANNVIVKLHNACVILYETQLPLKPLERDLNLSRQTMRNEIDYHKLFIPQKYIPPVSIPEEPAANVETAPTSQDSTVEEAAPEETTEEQIDNIQFIFEDEEVLDDIANSIKDYVTEYDTLNAIAIESTNLKLTQILTQAKEEEGKYNYKNAILLYQSALTKKDDDGFDNFVPQIYIKLAEDYKKLSQWYEALEYYTKAQDFYFNVSEELKVAEIKMEMANIYFAIYKQDNARYILKELQKNQNLPNELKIKINLGLAKLSKNLVESFECYKKAIPLIDLKTSKTTIAELYYGFASVNDERGNSRAAVNYYKKCIEAEPNPHKNKYISLALSNLAELYDEIGSRENAIKYYQQSIKIDKEFKNYNGLYGSVRHLAEIYSYKDHEMSLKYLYEAFDYANILNEPYYVIDTSIAIGSYFIVRKKMEEAYKYYIKAYLTAKNELASADTTEIEEKLHYIQSKTTEEEFKHFQEKYGS